MTPIPPESSQTNPILDPAAGASILARMLGKHIKSTMRSSMQELITPQLRQLQDGQKSLQAGLERLDGRVDATNQTVAALGARLDARIDELALQQGRMVEEVAALKREKGTTGDIVHRLNRIEDRLFAHAV